MYLAQCTATVLDCAEACQCTVQHPLEAHTCKGQASTLPPSTAVAHQQAWHSWLSTSQVDAAPAFLQLSCSSPAAFLQQLCRNCADRMGILCWPWLSYRLGVHLVMWRMRTSHLLLPPAPGTLLCPGLLRRPCSSLLTRCVQAAGKSACKLDSATYITVKGPFWRPRARATLMHNTTPVS